MFYHELKPSRKGGRKAQNLINYGAERSYLEINYEQILR